MVFDLGGGTLDLTIKKKKKTQDNSLNFDIILTEGDIHLGGSDFDNILKDYCIESFCAEYDINKKEVLNNYKACRRLKIKCESGYPFSLTNVTRNLSILLLESIQIVPL